ncbi:MAG: metallophosphoesterase family protein [Chitinophagaceae bacterium]|nr:metallophosphoesterase family protein [Chitinophagaceae bacterium]MCW5925560.1 metallophosphoesterase family protein [Chitinophagaceae bacterium]
MKIGIISDTHGYLDENVFRHFENCDEIWHAGDFGNKAIAEKLSGFKPLKGVFGNIDGNDIRGVYAEKLHFTAEKVPVFMQHIGGYPGRYAPGVKDEISIHGARLFISGHSHILKVIFDEKLQCLHINPGAAGKEGWHKVRTIVRLEIREGNMSNCEVIELGKR